MDKAAIVEGFRQLGGDAAADAADAFWNGPRDAEVIDRYNEICWPLYSQQPGPSFGSLPIVRNTDLFAHWNAGENERFDLRPDLRRAQCPVLVIAGELDPVSPITGAEELVDALPPELVRFERFANSGHGVFRDEPARAMRVLREFVTST